MNRRFLLRLAVVAGLAAAAWLFFRPRAGLPEPPTAAPPACRARLATLDRAARRATGASSAAALRELAACYAVNGFAPQAAATLAALQTRAPLAARDHYLLARTALDTGDLPAATRALAATVQLEPDYLPARVALGAVHFKSGDTAAAETDFRAVLAREPNHPEATVTLARLALQRRDDATAVSLLKELVAAHPEAGSAAALLARIYDRQGLAEAAREMTQKSQLYFEPRAADPYADALYDECFDAQRLALRFEELLYSGKFEAALPLLGRIESLAPGSWIPPMLRGWSFIRSGKTEPAIAAFREALAKGADRERLCPMMITALEKLGRAPEAWALAEESVAARPDSIPLLSAAAQIVQDGAGADRAKVFLHGVLEKNPDLYAANLALARVLWGEGDRAGAVPGLERVARIYATDIVSRGLLAQYFLEHDEPERALEPLEQAARAAERNPEALARLRAMLEQALGQVAQRLAERGDLPGARRRFDQLLAQTPDQPDALAGAANVAAAQQDYAAAASYLARLEQKDPANPTVALSLGDVLALGGNNTDARAAWARALPLAGRNAELVAALRERLARGPGNSAP